MKTMVRAGIAGLLLATGLPLAAEDHDSGILVTAVDPDGPAAAAGIERGDLILSIDGEPVANGRDFAEALAATAESQVNLSVKHGDDVRDQVVAIDRVWGRPRLGVMILSAPGRGGDFDRRGRMPDVRRMFRFDQMPAVPGALVMEVVEDGPAAAAGLQPGDWITAIGDEAVGDSNEHLAEIVESYQPGASVDVEFQRDGEAMTATVTLGANPNTGSALLGVRYRVLPFFRRGDMEDLRRLFDMLQERLERLQPAQPEPELEVPDSNQAL